MRRLSARGGYELLWCFKYAIYVFLHYFMLVILHQQSRRQIMIKVSEYHNTVTQYLRLRFK